jgi:class 3 adenylate cyclase
MNTETELAILFADVVGSTMLYEKLGDAKAREMVAVSIEVMRAATERHGGSVIKTMGDEVMATFPTADQAADAANQMQRAIAADPQLQTGSTHVAIRIGCHYGPVMVENRDVFGAAVHTANRMTSQAKAGQVITTEALVGQLSAEWRDCVRQIDVATLKGRSSEVALYEILWERDDVTSLVPTVGFAGLQRARRLRLRCQSRDFFLDEHQQQVTIGRAEDNGIVLKGNLISRLHARIEATRSRFLLVDQSTNGTFVQGVSGGEQFVRRDSLTLAGEGLIGLGRAPERGSPLTIEFACED